MVNWKLPVHKLGRSYVNKLCEIEYASQQFTVNERAVEYRFVFEHLARTAPHTVLDVGTGTTALPALMRTCGYLVTAVDNIRDYWPAGMFNRHFLVLDDDITQPTTHKRFDFITCISVLEHIPPHDAAVASMFGLLNPGGHLALTFPYCETEYVENVYKRPGSDACGRDIPFVCQVYSRDKVDGWLRASGGALREQEYWQFTTGEFWSMGEPVCPPRRVSREDRHQLTCLLIEKLAE